MFSIAGVGLAYHLGIAPELHVELTLTIERRADQGRRNS